MRITFILITLFGGHFLTGQAVIDTINEQVWEVFSHSYNTHNSLLFQSIHTPDLLRVSGNGKRIYDAQPYFDRTTMSFSKRKEQGQKVEISFRFLDRFVDGSKASEQGIYQLEIEEKDGSINHYYGQFHVLLRRDNGRWRIFMDYDANPNNEIGLQEFMQASPQN